jgi:hypothetical protein
MILTTFWIGGRITSRSYWVYVIVMRLGTRNNMWLCHLYLWSWNCYFKFEKSSGIQPIPAELIHAGGKKLRCEIHKLIDSIWNKEELPRQWKEFTILPNYRSVMSFMQNIIQYPSLKVKPVSGRNCWDHRSGFCRDKSNTDLIVSIHQTLEKYKSTKVQYISYLQTLRKSVIQLRR